MSYDLMVFDNSKAPLTHEDFIHWYNEKTTWSDELDYNNYKNASLNLQTFFMELINEYPPLNGELAPNDECFDDSDWCDKFESKCTDYSIGTDIIYCSFSWSESDKAYDIVKNLAKKHHIGFFNVSCSNGEIDYNH